MRHALVEGLLGIYTTLLPAFEIASAVAILILLPMTFIRSLRPWGGVFLVFASWLFGITTWLLGAAITFSSYGIFGLFIGLLFFGVGVVPIAIFAIFASIGSDWPTSYALFLIAMSVLTYGARIRGRWAAEQTNHL